MRSVLRGHTSGALGCEVPGVLIQPWGSSTQLETLRIFYLISHIFKVYLQTGSALEPLEALRALA